MSNFNRACPDIELLIKFKENHLKGEKKKNVENHLKTCKACKKVVEIKAPVLDQKSFARVKEIVEISNGRERPKTLSFGQIWGIKVGDCPKRLAVTTMGTKFSLDKNEKDLRVCPILIDFPFILSKTKSFIIEKTPHSELKTDFLIESWNEIPVMYADLDTYHGKLSKKNSDKLEAQLENTANDISNKDDYYEFKMACVKKTKALCSNYREKANNFVKNNASQEKDNTFVEKNNHEVVPFEFVPFEKLIPANENILLAAAVDASDVSKAQLESIYTELLKLEDEKMLMDFKLSFNLLKDSIVITSEASMEFELCFEEVNEISNNNNCSFKGKSKDSFLEIDKEILKKWKFNQTMKIRISPIQKNG